MDREKANAGDDGASVGITSAAVEFFVGLVFDIGGMVGPVLVGGTQCGRVGVTAVGFLVLLLTFDGKLGAVVGCADGRRALLALGGKLGEIVGDPGIALNTVGDSVELANVGVLVTTMGAGDGERAFITTVGAGDSVRAFFPLKILPFTLPTMIKARLVIPVLKDSDHHGRTLKCHTLFWTFAFFLCAFPFSRRWPYHLNQ